MPRAVARYVLLGLLFGCACFFQGGESLHLIRVLAHEQSTPDDPFEIAVASRTIATGPFRGDQLLAINGKPVASLDQAMEAVRASAPGQRLRLTLSEPSGHAIERLVTVPGIASSVHPGEAAVAICTRILIPAVSLTLGFAVVGIRPLDPNAWLLLIMLLGFSEAFEHRTWRGALPIAGLMWSGTWMSLWPVSTAWFGLRFPERFTWDRHRPWLKYVFMAAASATGSFYFAIVMLWHRDIGAAETFRAAAARAYFGWLASAIAGVTVFFWALALKIRRSSTADARRRLKILYLGATVAFTPAFCVVVYALASRQEPFRAVPWPITAITLLLVAVFPLTLAYVIVVERAMDLRFVLRQSLKYAIAKGGLYLIRASAVGYGLYILVRNIGRAGQESSTAVQLTTLAAALVLVGRRRTAGLASQWIDRKFFREAYDAEKVLSDLANEAGRFVEIGPLLEKVATRIGATLHVPDIVILLRDGDNFRTAYTTRNGEPLDIRLTSAIVTALGRHLEPLRVWFQNAPAWVRSLSGRDLQTLDFMRTQLLLPIPGKTGLAGMMSLGPKLSEAPYSDVDVRLTQSVAAQMGLAVENSRLVRSLAAEAASRERLNREIEIAREVQDRLFPQKFPKADGVECSGFCRPAIGVGGDYYDFLELEGGRIGLAIGDVSGKGIAAALLMASLQASLRGQAATGNHDLASLVTNINRLVYGASTSSRYATFFYGEYDPASRRLAFVNAGHNPPFVIRGSETLWLQATGTVVGLVEAAQYEQQACQLRPGDILVGFTDGISDAQNESEEDWGEERLLHAVRSLACKTPAAIIDGTFAAADAFTALAPQFDDMTMIVMKIASEGEGKLG